jgi:L-iditol 2-dehydrogenase
MPATATMSRAAVFRGTDRAFDLREFPVPEPAPGTVLLRMELCGICGTDVHYYQEGLRAPTILGHENAGIIEALGEGVETDSLGRPVRVGDRVVVQPGARGGAYGLRPLPDKDPRLTGGQSEYLYLNLPDTRFFKTDLPAEVAVLLEPFTVAIHAVERSRIRLGDTVVIQGSGAIGLMCLIAARFSGAAKTIVVGGPAGRLELARRLGADVVINIFEERDPAARREQVLAETPNQSGADVVMECAGVPAAIPEGIDLLRRGGMFCELGHFVDVGNMKLNPNRHMVWKDLNLVAPLGSRTEHFVRGLPIMERYPELFAGMVSHRLPLTRVQEAFEALSGRYHLDGRDAIKIAIAPWQDRN